MISLDVEEVMRLTVLLDSPKIIGRVENGTLQVIPIIGGLVKGKRNQGKIVPGGADWNTQHDDRGVHFHAKYFIETNDNEFILVENVGFIGAKSNALIRTTPEFSAAKNGKYCELNYGAYVGEL